MLEIRRRHLSSDVFITGSNAVTETGELVNLDGTGQRVAAMIFGPGKVVVVAGVKEARRSLEGVARDLGPELEQAREELRDVAEDVGDELRGVADRLKGRRKKEGFHCPACGARNAETAKFCVECGKAIA